MRDRLQSPDVQIPLALALAIALALGEWRWARSLRRNLPDANVAARPAAKPSAAEGPLDGRVAEGLALRLSEVPRGAPAWIAASAEDPDALARAEQIRTILRRAGWDVRPLVRTSIRTRPGYFVFAADEDPPAYVTTLASAFDSVGIKPTFALGYRAYYDEMSRTRPGFAGFAFEPEQTFLLVVGRATGE